MLFDEEVCWQLLHQEYEKQFVENMKKEERRIAKQKNKQVGMSEGAGTSEVGKDVRGDEK